MDLETFKQDLETIHNKLIDVRDWITHEHISEVFSDAYIINTFEHIEDELLSLEVYVVEMNEEKRDDQIPIVL